MVAKKILFLTLIFSTHFVFSQKDADINKISNFDKKFSLTDLKEVYELSDRFEKAKKEKDYEFLSDYYRLQWTLYDKEKNLIVLDSSLYYAKLSKKEDLIGEAYLTKGRLFYIEKDHTDALNNYLIADKYLENSKNSLLKYSTLLHIASIKAYLNESEEAIDLFSKCITYFKSQNDYKSERLYLLSLSGINMAYYRIDNYKKLFENNRLLLKESERLKDQQFFNYSLIVLGYERYMAGEYNSCIETVEKGLEYILENTEDFTWIGISYYHIGRSYWKLDEKKKALNYFNKVDSLFNEYQYADKTFRPMYEILINHHKSLGQQSEQLYYVNQLLKLDSINTAHFEYISPKIHKEYDTNKLILEKQQLETNYKKQSRSYQYVIIIGALGLIFLIIWSVRLIQQKRSFKEKYDLLINIPATIQPIGKVSFEIANETSREILEKLQRFEERKNFLQSNLTLNKLASQLKTNSSYLSKTINDIKGKTFTNYLNELKINYIIQLLKEESKYRSYTIDAIAELAGYNTRQSFSKAFYDQTGIRPSYFLKEIQKENK
ncbi:helix-turn-helix domain-containing protein [Moheibacter sediminis]|uniref:AraC-type DNA-binding protein n=1 Tax=Moheibacter sediminis TaxID=1434700 RepID=A0A1W2BAZ4_9FLAO|nr:AraC family transcriptional regulator [Moheibacter sediminis]SMC70145.1 AraC-type DNA-binding protein [Moheibacter sediminis]